MSDYHEPFEHLSEATRNYNRALNSLKEEVEAVNWYQQRVDLTNDEDLKRILEHNRDEEIEHAVMTLEWLRRNMPGWDEEMREILFTDGPIGEHAHGHDGEDHENPQGKDLGLGNLK